MIPLADSWWIHADASGWWLIEMRRVGRAKPSTHRHGPYSSPKHVQQQRKVTIPKPAREALAEWLYAIGSGDDLVDEAPDLTVPPES